MSKNRNLIIIGEGTSQNEEFPTAIHTCASEVQLNPALMFHFRDKHSLCVVNKTCTEEIKIVSRYLLETTG